MVTFCTVLHHEKSKWLLSRHEKKKKKKSSGLVVIGFFQENQLKDKYVTNKMEIV